MTIEFNRETFSAEGAEPVWPSSDTWYFTDNGATHFTRGDDVEVEIESIDRETLVLKLHWNETGTGDGHSLSLDGEHVFTFIR